MADKDKIPNRLARLFEIAQTAPPPEPAPVVPEEPKPAEVPPSPPTPPPAPETPEASIPSWRLREEAEARRLAETRAQTLEARLNEITAHLRQGQKQPSFFENPDEATQALIAKTLQPFAEEQRRQVMYLGKMVAESVHGADKVAEAERAFLEARSRETLDPADYERVVQSPNRYDAAVQWHNRQSTLSIVGNDPKAWFEKELESRMADPQFQAKLLEKVRGSAAARPAVTKLPPSLSKATAAASNAGDREGDMSDASLFAYAMKK
jgi:hypothetical protein